MHVIRPQEHLSSLIIGLDRQLPLIFPQISKRADEHITYAEEVFVFGQQLWITTLSHADTPKNLSEKELVEELNRVLQDGPTLSSAEGRSASFPPPSMN